jgi:hypothetical protein
VGTFLRYPLYEEPTAMETITNHNTHTCWKWQVCVVSEVLDGCVAYNVMFAQRGQQQTVFLEKKTKGLLWMHIGEEELEFEIKKFKEELMMSNRKAYEALCSLFVSSQRILPQSTATCFGIYNFSPSITKRYTASQYFYVYAYSRSRDPFFFFFFFFPHYYYICLLFINFFYLTNIFM